MPSVAEVVMQNLQSTIAALAPFAAVTAGGCQRFEQTGEAIEKLPTALLLASDEDKEEGPQDGFSCSLQVSVVIAATHPTDWDDSSEAYLDSLIRAVEKGVMAQRDRGVPNSCVDTKLRGHSKIATPSEDDRGYELLAAEVRMTIEYRHLRTDPEVAY